MDTIRYYTINQVCAMLSIGRTKSYELMNTGALQYITIGSVRRVSHADLLRFQEARPIAA